MHLTITLVIEAQPALLEALARLADALPGAPRRALPDPVVPAPAAEAPAQRRRITRGKPVAWSAERDALLGQIFESSEKLDIILARVNELPGPRIDKKKDMMNHANRLGYFRRAERLAPAPDATASAPPSAEPVPAPRRASALPRVAASGPIVASAEFIRRWGSERGVALQSRGEIDIESINTRRTDLGMAPFKLEERAR